MPVIPREQFKGQTGQGDWADSLLELDTDFGTLLDLLGELGLADDTVVVFAGDNGPDEVQLWRGTPAVGRAPTSPEGKATCAPRASRAGPAASPPGRSATRSCTSPTGSPPCRTPPGPRCPATG
jgi:arylsulfatase